MAGSADGVDVLREAVHLLIARQDLPGSVMEQAMQVLMTGRADAAEAAAFLTALRMKGESPDELATAARVLRRHMEPLDIRNLPAVDTCGTGGDQTGTLNLSTAAAFVVAGCGVPVVKHGNRAVSSRSGSADVLTALGVRVDVPPAIALLCLEEGGMAFCFAPRYHPAMRHVARVRQALGFRTLFNLLGPLCNPAGVRYQLLGVGRPELLDLMANTLLRLGSGEAFVVHGSDGLDEVSLTGPTIVRWVRQSGLDHLIWAPEDFGLPRHSLEEIRVADAAESAARIRTVLAGQHGPDRDFVLANAAAVLVLVRAASDLRDAVARAAEAIDSGKALAVLQKLIRLTTEAVVDQS